MARLVFNDHSAMWRTGSDFPQIPLTIVSWDSAPDTPVAFVYFGHVNIDFDGSPTAYGPPGISPQPDDDLWHARDADRWFGVVALAKNDPAVTSGDALIDTGPDMERGGKFPVVQQEKNGDPNPGFFVSATPHATGPAWQQSSYIDASRVPFAALSGKLRAQGVSLGDFGLAVRHDQAQQSGFFFADEGANNFALGECSHRVGKDLGGTGRSNAFNNNFPVSFIVFPQSTTQDPQAVVAMSDDDIANALRPLLANLAAAENANDLPLLMAFNEVAPRATPTGTSRLAAYANDPDNTPEPKNIATVTEGLRTWGYGE